MDKVNIASFFLAAMSLFGNYFVNKKNVLGFYIWIVANVLWASLYYYIDQKGSFFLMLMYIVLCFHGIYSWNKTKED
jgi:nicotinamide riboside transporter PnuC